MGFEITYHYHERKEGGGYDTDEKKSMTKKVGKAYDNTPLSKAAKAILGQLARRDIWVVDVELKEFVKKDLSFKESSDGRGILLKGKKFTIDSTDGVEVEEYDEEEYYDDEYEDRPRRSRNLAQPRGKVPQVNQETIKFMAILSEDQAQYSSVLKQHKVTGGREYPVHRTRPARPGSMQKLYAITDDTGKVIELSEEFFAMKPQALLGGFEADATRESRPKLSYESQLTYDHVPTQTQAPARVDPNMIPEEYRHLPIEGMEGAEVIPAMQNIRPDYTPKR